MLAALAMLVQTAACISSASLVNHHWIPGDYRAIAVTRSVPSDMKWARDRPALIQISRSRAASLVSNELPDVRYYYLTETLFFGNEGKAQKLPAGVEVYFTPDTDEVAYLFSDRLGRMNAIAGAPVVLTSNVPLKAVVPVCDGAV